MSMKRLVEADCGGANPLMQIGGQFTRDLAFQDEGLAGFRPPTEGFVNEFLGQASAAPQTFQMNNILQEMREIESRSFNTGVESGPRVIDQVANEQWAKDYAARHMPQLANFSEVSCFH